MPLRKEALWKSPDVLDIYDFFVGLEQSTADQVVASNVTWATAGDTVSGMDDVLTAYDMFVGKDGDAYVILEDASTGSRRHIMRERRKLPMLLVLRSSKGEFNKSLQAYFLLTQTVTPRLY